MYGMEVLRSSILITLQEGNITPGFTAALNEILKHSELLPLWQETTYESRRAEELSEEVKEQFEKLESALFSVTAILEIAAENLDTATFNKLITTIQAEGINLVDESKEGERVVGLRGNFGWFPLLGTAWPG